MVGTKDKPKTNYPTESAYSLIKILCSVLQSGSADKLRDIPLLYIPVDAFSVGKSVLKHLSSSAVMSWLRTTCR